MENEEVTQKNGSGDSAGHSVAATGDDREDSEGRNDRLLILVVALLITVAVAWITVKDELMRDAVENGQETLVKFLVFAGADPNGLDDSGWTALSRAASSGDLRAAKLLLAAGTDVNVQGSNGGTPLMSAIDGSHEDLVRVFLEAGAKVNARDVEGWTPLMTAALYDNSGLVKDLLEAGAEVSAKNNSRATALSLAAFQGHAETVRMLLEAGADVNSRDFGGAHSVNACPPRRRRRLDRLRRRGERSGSGGQNRPSTRGAPGCERLCTGSLEGGCRCQCNRRRRLDGFDAGG